MFGELNMNNYIKTLILNLLSDEEGASGIEYALIAAMVAIAIVAFVGPINTAVTSIFTSIQTALAG
jgi:pilus assembly protein Flp/PilA